MNESSPSQTNLHLLNRLYIRIALMNLNELSLVQLVYGLNARQTPNITVQAEMGPIDSFKYLQAA